MASDILLADLGQQHPLTCANSARVTTLSPLESNSWKKPRSASRALLTRSSRAGLPRAVTYKIKHPQLCSAVHEGYPLAHASQHINIDSSQNS